MPRKDRVPALIHGLRLVSALIVAIVVFSAVHAQSQVFHLIHSFASTLGDGNEPNAGLVADAAGNFYGTTWSGGHSMNCPNGGCGSIFERFSNGGFGLIYSFTGGNDGSNPAADLIVGSNGNLYSTTQFGGPTGSGTVFEFVPSTGIKTVLHLFGGGVSDGCTPIGGLVQVPNGDLYGTTTACGQFGGGVVFSLSPGGGYQVLHHFGQGLDGVGPQGDLALVNGVIYGTTQVGGNNRTSCVNGCGTIFSLLGGTYSVVYNFGNVANDGLFPESGLLRDAQGNLFGSTVSGGANNFNCTPACGTVFELRLGAHQTKTLYTFTANNDGFGPRGRVTLYGGNLFGATGSGGNNCGAVFQVTLAGVETTLHTFNGPTDGCNGIGSVIVSSGPVIYGVTRHSGIAQDGTVFEILE
jgi:uncharacterized repeat protein (TIGR03803 family)